jgi:hypothetical protein
MKERQESYIAPQQWSDIEVLVTVQAPGMVSGNLPVVTEPDGRSPWCVAVVVISAEDVTFVCNRQESRYAK